MQRNMKRFLIMIPFLVLSGCIFSATPTETTLSLTWGQSQTFQITGSGTFQWYVNDTAITGESGTSFQFKSASYALGTYRIKVTSQFGVLPIAQQEWTVTVNSPTATVPTATSCADVSNAGLVCQTISNCSDTLPQGTVISQSPAAGTVVPAGATVTLTVASGPCTIEVAVPAATSCAQILAAGLVCDTTYQCSTSVQGSVIGQSPAAGTMVQPGTTVTLTISSGPCTVEVEVPIAASCDDIENAGLVCGTTWQCSDLPKKSVISQSPEAGTMVLPDSTVNLYLSSGPCGTSVPDVTTCAELEAAGLVCNTVLYCSNTVPAGGFIGLSPVAGTGVEPGSTVNLILSSGPCPVEVPTATSCADITNAGLVCATTTTCSNTVPAGVVINQSPVAGTLVTRGSTVTLTISSGQCAQQLAAPQNVQATDVVLTSTSDPTQNHNLNNRVTITWNAVTNADYYEIYRADTATGTYTLLNTTTAVTYDDLQSETLTLPTWPTDLTAANITAYKHATRPIIRDFKNFKYYKVRACSNSALYTGSDLSGYDEGRIDYTLEEFFSVAKVMAGVPLAQVFIQDSSVGVGTNEYVYDPCGDGNVHFTVTQSGLSGVLTITFTNFIDSLIYYAAADPTNDTTDCSVSGNRRMIVNGTVNGTISGLTNDGSMSGSVAFTGNYAGKYTSISIPIVDQKPQAGTCTVIYNGETMTGHVFTF